MNVITRYKRKFYLYLVKKCSIRLRVIFKIDSYYSDHVELNLIVKPVHALITNIRLQPFIYYDLTRLPLTKVRKEQTIMHHEGCTCSYHRKPTKSFFVHTST